MDDRHAARFAAARAARGYRQAMVVDVPVPPRSQLVLVALGAAVGLAACAVYWAARSFHGELRWPSLAAGGLWLLVVGGSGLARHRLAHGAIDRRLAIVLTSWSSERPVGYAASVTERDVTLHLENGRDVPYRATDAASRSASEGDVGVACIQRGALVWFERLEA